MVFIKKLEIYGFKSFGFKNTVLNFDNGLVAVTGPNGSGKSNVFDAIMFSLGENSTKALRVGKFQELFHDMQNRSHRLVRVSVTFDNNDRGIPINSDNVTLTREMEDLGGESQYYLNGKKVTKTTITELLEMVVAVPNKINIVQQGMITRISELNSEERRKIIEDIVGLSYFDEKKEEALQQLEESDRRLDIALARMGEIRKRIDELEVERNEQLRFQHLENDIKKYKAAKTSNDIKAIRLKISLNNKELETKTTLSRSLSIELTTIQDEIQKLDLEKIKFMQEVDLINKQKAEVSSKTSTIVYEVARTRAIYEKTLPRIEEIKNRLKSIRITKNEITHKLEGLESDIKIKERTISALKDEENVIINNLINLDDKIVNVNSKNKELEIEKIKIDERLTKILNLNHIIEINISRYSENLKINKNQIKEIDYKLETLQKKILNSLLDLEKFKSQILQQKLENKELGIAQEKLEERIRELNSDIVTSTITLDESDDQALKLQENNNTLNQSMPEDLAISEIGKNRELSFIGVVHDLIRWDRKYHRAVMAAGTEWMKAVVVNKIDDMINIAEFVKAKKLPKIKIIALDIIEEADQIEITRDDVGIIGHLSNFVTSEYKKLVNSLFGNIIVVRTASDAYKLAQKGYRTVSLDGELFEVKSRTLLVDYNSKLINVVREINLRDDINNLRSLILELKNRLDRRILNLNKLTEKISNLENRKLKLESSLPYLEEKIKSIGTLLTEIQSDKNNQMKLKEEIENTNKLITNHLQKNEKRYKLVTVTRNKINSRLSEINSKFDKSDLNDLNIERNRNQSMTDSKNHELHENSISLTTRRNDRDLSLDRLASLEREYYTLETEMSEKESRILQDKKKIETDEEELKSLRYKEQEIIDSAGNSYSVLQTYEQKLKTLRKSEMDILKENNTLEREIVLLKKENSNLTDHEQQLNNDLMWLGYKDPIAEYYDVEEIMRSISEEYDILKNRINLRANENYVQIVDGYRGMSERKNDLEKERNAIVLFIEEINKEKKEMFMEAFTKVNHDINRIFSSIINGNSWLEIENEEDVFSGGIRLVVQFPDKPRRDSTTLSGGEKTMAATVFLLALQSIKPSPFYLMDEIDAHLDAQNTERLSKILFERAKKNQIIIVTLKDSTISKVDQIYGVYPREGISQILKYKHPEKALLDNLTV